VAPFSHTIKLHPSSHHNPITTPSPPFSQRTHQDCPPILNRIRAKHALPHGAFIVPADVHDYLFDEGLMDPAIFGGVHGGSVLEDEHIDALIQTLKDFPANDDAAAAFFFHEHVTAVLKSKDGYEFVDSLPHSPVGMGVRILCTTPATLKVCLQWYCLQKFSPNNQAYIDRNAWNEDRAEVDPRIFQAYVWHQPQG
jgi:hypothetical protein